MRLDKESRKIKLKLQSGFARPLNKETKTQRHGLGKTPRRTESKAS